MCARQMRTASTRAAMTTRARGMRLWQGIPATMESGRPIATPRGIDIVRIIGGGSSIFRRIVPIGTGYTGVTLANTVPLAQTVSTVLQARTLSLEVLWSQIASALLVCAALMAEHVNPLCVVLGNTVPLAQTVSTVLLARTLSLEVLWSQIASALLAWAARMVDHVNRALWALSPTLIQPIQPKLLPRVHHVPAAGRLRGRVQQCAPSTARATTLPILSTSTQPLRSRR